MDADAEVSTSIFTPGGVRCWMSGDCSRLAAFQYGENGVLEGGGATFLLMKK